MLGLARAARRPGDRAAGRLLLSKVRPIAEELAAALREHPGAHRVEVAGSVRRWAETCKDIDLIATAEEPAALAEHLAAHPLIAAAGNAGRQRRPRPDPQRRLGRPADRPARPPSATCSSTSPAPRPTTSQLREDAVKRGLSVSEHGITETESGEVDPLRERAGGLRAARLRLHRAGAARGPRRAEGGARRQAAGAGRARRHRAATCTPTRPSPTAATRLDEMAEAGRARGYAYMAITDHSASHGFGDHVTAGAALAADRGGRAPGTRANAASACWPARRSTSASTARSTTPTTWSPRSTGSSPASTPPSRSPKRR